MSVAGVSPAGTVDRAVSILEHLARAPSAHGLALAEVAEALSLNKTTARRLLVALEEGGLVAQAATTRRYKLGLGLVCLGLVAERQVDLAAVCADSLDRIALASGDRVLLFGRSGDQSVCLAAQPGPFPIQLDTDAVGARHPLAATGAGITILAALAVPEAADIVARAPEPLNPLAPHLVRSMVLTAIADTAERGWYDQGGLHFQGVSELGVAVLDAKGAPQGAIMLSYLAARDRPERKAALVEVLRREQALIAQRLMER